MLWQNWALQLQSERGEGVMAKIYFKRVIARLMTIDEVPELWRAQVQEMLDGQNKNTI